MWGDFCQKQHDFSTVVLPAKNEPFDYVLERAGLFQIIKCVSHGAFPVPEKRCFWNSAFLESKYVWYKYFKKSVVFGEAPLPLYGHYF